MRTRREVPRDLANRNLAALARGSEIGADHAGVRGPAHEAGQSDRALPYSRTARRRVDIRRRLQRRTRHAAGALPGLQLLALQSLPTRGHGAAHVEETG